MDNASQRRMHDPYIDSFPEAREFWIAAAEGRLLVKMCTACRRAHWYPRVVCPLCGSLDTIWQAASGGGTVYAFSLARRLAPQNILAYVVLDEGPTLMTNIINADVQDLRIGQRVSVIFDGPEGERLLPFFEPIKQ